MPFRSVWDACLTSSVLIALFLVIFISCARAADIPDPDLTPGVSRKDLSLKEICSTKWGKDARKVTAAMKRQVFTSYGLSGNTDKSCTSKRHFEIDHSISRELGGADDIKNLWPQCYSGEWNAVMKDRLENRMHKEICEGSLSLKQAQKEISGDWRVPYQRYFGEK